MNRTLLAAAAALATLAGTTSAFAQEEPTACEQLYLAADELYDLPEKEFTLTDTDGSIVCHYVDDAWVQTNEDGAGLSQAMENVPEQGMRGLAIAFDAIGGPGEEDEPGVDGRELAGGLSDRSGGDSVNTETAGGSDNAGTRGGRDNAGARGGRP